MLELSPEQLETVRRLLAEQVPGIEVRAFGSRVKGTAKKYSDLDLVVMGKEQLPQEVLFRLQDVFEESELPIRIDVLDWHRITPGFRAMIERGSEIVQRATP